MLPSQDAYILAEWRSNAIINPTTGALQNIVYTVNGAGATRGQANTDIFMSVPRPGNPTGRQPIAGFPSNLRRGLGEDGNSTGKREATAASPLTRYFLDQPSSAVMRVRLAV